MRPAGHLVLIGMPGSGKSKLGRIIAEHHALPFYDVDQQIEERVGKTINTIFADHGEEFFRTMETKMLNTLLAEPPGVIACGGGSILMRVNRARIARGGNQVIYLRADAALLAHRLGTQDNRPLLAAKDPTAKKRKITALLRHREPLYRATAHMTLTIDPRMTAQENAKRLLTMLAARADKVQ